MLIFLPLSEMKPVLKNYLGNSNIICLPVSTLLQRHTNLVHFKTSPDIYRNADLKCKMIIMSSSSVTRVGISNFSSSRGLLDNNE